MLRWAALLAVALEDTTPEALLRMLGNTQLSSRVACVDGPLGARGMLHDLTSGAMAVMCPAFDAAR